MSANVHDYLIDHSGFDWPNLLKDWSWLLPRQVTVWLMNRFRDLFLVFDDGAVHMLEIGGGSLTKVAESRDDFCAKIDLDDNANNWLMIPLVDRLVDSGMRLAPGKCYHSKFPPIVGGDYTLENIAVVDIAEHYGFYGSVHEQLKDVPDGTEVVFNIVNKPPR